MKRRFLAMLFSVCMILAASPISVFAGDSSQSSSSLPGNTNFVENDEKGESGNRDDVNTLSQERTLTISTTRLAVASTDTGGQSIEVSDEAGFLAALKNPAIDVINLAGTIQILTSSGGDDALVIGRAVTIQGGGLSFRHAGIVLGGAVTFQNTTIEFANTVRNAIIANGYPLTLNNVRNSGNLSIHLFCGGISGYSGTNAGEIPSAGNNGYITISGSNQLGNIYAGSFSDGATEADAKENTFSGAATITIASDASGTIGSVYAHGARESRGQGTGDVLYADPVKYTATGGVTINLNNGLVKTVDCRTGGTTDASVVYGDDGKGYFKSIMLNSVGALTLKQGSNGSMANLQMNTYSSFSDKGASVSIPAGTRLDLTNMGNDAPSITSLSGGGELVLESLQSLSITGAVSGTTKLAIGGVSYDAANSTGIVYTGHNYIAASNAAANSFVLLPPTSDDTLVMIRDANGSWSAATPVAVTGITLNKNSMTLTEGASETLTPTILPDGATNKNVTWSSDDNNTATVVNGTVTAVKAGTTTITATATDGSGVKASCSVTVMAPVAVKTYKLTYNANGGSGTMAAQSFTEKTGQSLSTNVYTREGYTFNGWNTAADGSGTAYADRAAVTLTQDITLFAQWIEKSDGGTGSGSSTGGNTGTGSGSSTGDNTGTGSGSSTGGNTGTGSGSSTGDNTGTGSGSSTGDNTGTGSGSSTGGSTGTGSGDSAGGNAGTGSGSSTGGNTGTESGSSTGGNMGTGSGSSTGGNTGSGSSTGGNTGTGNDTSTNTGSSNSSTSTTAKPTGSTAGSGGNQASSTLAATKDKNEASPGTTTPSGNVTAAAGSRSTKPVENQESKTVKTRLEIDRDFVDEDIPKELKDKGYDAVEKIEAELKTQITEISEEMEGTILYDVILMYSSDGGSIWNRADETHFPNDGRIQVVLPVPGGSDPIKHDYFALHMFTSDAFGKVPGDIEQPEVTVKQEADGKYYLEFYVTGLSPVLISWQEKEDDSSEVVSESVEASEPESTVRAEEPLVEESSNMGMWIGLAAAIVAVLVICGILWWRKNAEE